MPRFLWVCLGLLMPAAAAALSISPDETRDDLTGPSSASPTPSSTVAAAAAPSASTAPRPTNKGAVAAAAVLLALLALATLGGLGLWLYRRRTRTRITAAKFDAAFAIEDAAPPPPPLSEMRTLSAGRPALSIVTPPAPAGGLRRGVSTMTRSSVSGGAPLSPALASSVMEYAPYGAPARMLDGRSASRRGRANRQSRIRSLVWPGTAMTEQSIAELQEEPPLPLRPASGAGRTLPLPPAALAPPVPVKEDKPARVVRASDLPPVPPLPTAAADLVSSVSTLPATPGASSSGSQASSSQASSSQGRRLPLPPPPKAGPAF